MAGYQSSQTTCQKTLSPALNIRELHLKHAGYRTHFKARAQRENDLGAPDVLRRNRSESNAPAHFSAFRRTNHHSFALHSLTMTDFVSHITVTSH